ncbi:MAG: hypothetical protein AAF383_06310 [Cyanobacteria bacterium P01_A01_bin.83]
MIRSAAVDGSGDNLVWSNAQLPEVSGSQAIVLYPCPTVTELFDDAARFVGSIPESFCSSSTPGCMVYS